MTDAKECCGVCRHFRERESEISHYAYDGTCRIRSGQSIVVVDQVFSFPPRDASDYCHEFQPRAEEKERQKPFTYSELRSIIDRGKDEGPTNEQIAEKIVNGLHEWLSMYCNLQNAGYLSKMELKVRVLSALEEKE